MKKLLIVCFSLCMILAMDATVNAGKQPPRCLDLGPGQPTCSLDTNTNQVCCMWDTTNTSNAAKYSLDFDVSVDTSGDCIADITEEVSIGTSDYEVGPAMADGLLCIPWDDFVADLTGTPVSATAKVKGLIVKVRGTKCRQSNSWSPKSESFDLGCK
jgi:hypothetical protein